MFLDLLLLAIAGIGGLVVHELGHGLSYRVLCPSGTWRLSVRGAAVSVVVDPVPIGIRRCAVAIAGPLAGAAFVLGVSLLSPNDGVFDLLVALHLVMMVPLFADGRHVVGGLREAVRTRSLDVTTEV